MNSLSTLLRNAGFSVGADLSARLANAVLFISITHYLGADAAGAFSLGITYFLITSRFGYWGLDHLFIREVSPQHNLSAKYFANFAALRAIIAVAMVAIAAVVVWQLPYEYETRVVIVIMLVAVLPENITNICQSVFIAHERMEFVGLVSLCLAIVRIVVSLLVLFSGAALPALAVVFSLTSFAGLIAYLLLLCASIRFFTIDDRPGILPSEPANGRAICVDKRNLRGRQPGRYLDAFISHG